MEHRGVGRDDGSSGSSTGDNSRQLELVPRLLRAELSSSQVPTDDWKEERGRGEVAERGVGRKECGSR